MSGHEDEKSAVGGPLRYPFSQLTLTPSGAIPLIKEVLNNTTAPLSRAEIVNRIERLHVSRGGRLDRPGSTMGQVKRALGHMREAGQVTPVGHGHYISADSSSAAGVVDTEADDEGDDEVEENEESDSKIKVLDEIGSGADKVYVYFFERDRELARYRNEDFWPCKIGFTKTDVVSRILGQGAATSMHSYPVVGLIIHTDHCKLIEQMLHNALRLAGRAVPDSPGTEWFRTTPDVVRSWYLAFIQTLTPLRGSS